MGRGFRDWELRIGNLGIANCGLRIADSGLRIADLGIADYWIEGFWVTNLGNFFCNFLSKLKRLRAR